MQSELATLHNECKALEQSIWAFQHAKNAIQVDLHGESVDDDDFDFLDCTDSDADGCTTLFGYENEILRTYPGDNELCSAW